ncbi:carbamoyltransferase HypF [Ferruginibacter paludis]|uniref:carbamoyltransferase HypF n=1 Tax=Ferruginibacter paludis TaxID=1310417 RepID=UPI0025B5D9B2|nr:carbamoyltransferase HypF [Ferruginibacter paludis]MDN3656537.1 carbamoyltransferase HypF [Ferruginibacter paludis]
MQTYHIHITGLVQGVGFRPFVWQLATAMNLNGWVNNSSDGVHIEINGSSATAAEFYNQVIAAPPPLSVIQQHSMYPVVWQQFDNFQIQDSKITGPAKLAITPDYAMCNDCRDELHNATDYRYQYPFITCTQCGPRYSVIKALPYDRINTSMESFGMCAVCKQEYNNPADRRYYSQTNSCAACGVGIKLFNNENKELSSTTEYIIRRVVESLDDGKIVAVKGIGGYLFLCDAGNKNTIALLRQRKHRPSKPFALMYPSINMVAEDFILDEARTQLLQSASAPIVLLKTSQQAAQRVCMEEIAPGLSKLGVMLPYAPLFELILTDFKKPVIATSGNISEAAIVFDDDIALKEFSAIADLIVTHNREIVISQDDSVMQLTEKTNTKIIHRRSRGLAPSFFDYASNKNSVILSTGALLKSSFCLAQQGNVYISQYLGNTDTYEAQQSFEKAVQHYFSLFSTSAGVVIADKHPGYFSHHFARQLSEEKQLPFVTVQHHKAHFAAVLAENNLLKTETPVMGVIWDGVGLGDDGQVWGGEFFKYHNESIQRCYYFGYFPVIAGDKMAREPRLSALAVCHESWVAEDLLKNKFTEQEWSIYQKILQQDKLLNCSSAGRLFDAVASLLNLADKQTYEGEAAMLLEEKAASYFEQNGWDLNQSYFMDGAHYNHIPTGILISNIVMDIKKGLTVDFIAAKFHYSLAHLVRIIAGYLDVKMIACSGGVFQNAVLVDLCKIRLANDYQLFFHKNLSPNDENISFGQLVYYENNIDNNQLA